MKKIFLTIIIFMAIMFAGSRNVFALGTNRKCEYSSNNKECREKLLQRENSVISDSSSYFPLCTQVVNYDGKQYLNMIRIDWEGELSYISSYDGSDIDLKDINMSEEDESNLRNGMCPKNHYIKDYWDVGVKYCFEYKDGECKKLNENYTKKTEGSELIENNLDVLKLMNIGLKNECNALNHRNDLKSVCRYTNGDASRVVIFNGENSTLGYWRYIVYYDINNDQRMIFKYEEKNQNNNVRFSQITNYNYKMFRHWSLVSEEINDFLVYEFLGNTTTCPTEIYFNYMFGANTNFNLLVGGTFWQDYLIAMDNQVRTDAESTEMFEGGNCKIEKPKEEEIVKIEDCDTLFGSELLAYIDEIMAIIRIAIPIMLIGLIVYDLLTGVFANSDDQTKKAKDRTIKRIIIAVVIFFVPTLINLTFSIVNDIWGEKFEICGMKNNTD